MKLRLVFGVFGKRKDVWLGFLKMGISRAHFEFEFEFEFLLLDLDAISIRKTEVVNFVWNLAYLMAYRLYFYTSRIFLTGLALNCQFSSEVRFIEKIHEPKVFKVNWML